MSEKLYTDADVEIAVAAIARSWGYDSIAAMDAVPDQDAPMARAEARAVLDTLVADGWRRTDADSRHIIEFSDSGWTMTHPRNCPAVQRPGAVCDVAVLAELFKVCGPTPPPGRYAATVDGRGRLRIGDRLNDAGDPPAADMNATGDGETYHAKDGPDKPAPIGDGTRLVEALKAAGFTVAGQRAGMYVRLSWPDSHPRAGTLVVPVGDEYADYGDLLAAALGELEYAARRGEAARMALDLHRMETQP